MKRADESPIDAAMNFDQITRQEALVRVHAPGRLHLGFLDLNGGLGRRFGSLGLSIERPVTCVTAGFAPALRVGGTDAERAEAALLRIAAALDLDTAIHLRVEAALPPHVGMGSGTQLGLAVGAALAALNGIDLPPRRIADLLDRGQRSAIGLGAFETGGVILDGGRGAAEGAPPILARLPVPHDWRILLVGDTEFEGLSGKREMQAMAALGPFPETLSAALCRLVVMQALPSLAEGDADGFGQAVGEIQRRLGDHFADAQGGRFTSPAVAEVLDWAEQKGIPGVGQSSWGPTGFVIIGDRKRAEGMADEARSRWSGHPSLTLDLVRGNNSGAEIATGSNIREGDLMPQGDA